MEDAFSVPFILSWSYAIYNAYQYSASEDPDRVETLISQFEEFFTGEVSETYERFMFNYRNQEVGESFDAYLEKHGGNF